MLGYSSDMPDLMRIASLFIGKPGGLSSSECMAAGLPMVLIKPIPGQEERNSDYLLEQGAAVKCNYEGTIGYKIDEILSEPGRLERMTASARRIGHPDAAATVAAAVASDDAPPVWITRAARESMVAASEQGMSAVDLDTDQRLKTLYHQSSGRSAAVITKEQLDSLGPEGQRGHLVPVGRRPGQPAPLAPLRARPAARAASGHGRRHRGHVRSALGPVGRDASSLGRATNCRFALTGSSVREPAAVAVPALDAPAPLQTWQVPTATPSAYT